MVQPRMTQDLNSNEYSMKLCEHVAKMAPRSLKKILELLGQILKEEINGNDEIKVMVFNCLNKVDPIYHNECLDQNGSQTAPTREDLCK